MSSLDFDQDAFYICTETSPRCFVVQKAIQMDRGQIERVMKMREGGTAANHSHSNRSNDEAANVATPPAPPLPHWFDEQCRRDLMSVEAQLPCDMRLLPTYEMSVCPSLPTLAAPSSLLSPLLHSSLTSLPSPSPPSPRPDIKSQLRAQLEYYFSRENLITDRYLRCQMDADQYVPISIIAGFRKIVQLTNDYGLIVQTLRESPNVEVDERGEKVRPLSKRCTILIRQLNEEHADGVREMLEGGPPYLSLRYGLPSSWYVTYESEEATQRAYLHLQNLPTTPNGQPICARIKTGGPPVDAVEMPLVVVSERMSPSANSPSPLFPSPTPILDTPLTSTVFDLGRILASAGFYPRATYRPGTTVVRVDEIPARQPRDSRGGYVGGGERRGRGRGGGGVGRGSSASSGGRGGGGSRAMNGGSRYQGERRRDGGAAHTSNGNSSYNGGGRRQWGWSEGGNNWNGGGRQSGRESDEGAAGDVGRESYAFEENSFPTLVQPLPPPEPKEQRLSFSSVAAGRKRETAEQKKSYAQSLHVSE